LLVSVGAALSVMDIIKALQRLSPKEYQTVRLFALEGMGRPDIAEAMGVGVDAVKARLQAAYQELGVAQGMSPGGGVKRTIEDRQLDFYMFVFVRRAILHGERQNLIAPYIARNPDHDYTSILASIQNEDEFVDPNTHIVKRLKDIGAKISSDNIIASLEKLS